MAENEEMIGVGVTPRPWSWVGEDYRGGWGMMLLAGPDGQGVACGVGPGRIYAGLRAHIPIEPHLVKTGMLRQPDSAPPFHIRQVDADYMLRAVNSHDAMLAALKLASRVLSSDHLLIGDINAAIEKGEGR